MYTLHSAAETPMIETLLKNVRRPRGENKLHAFIDLKPTLKQNSLCMTLIENDCSYFTSI